MHIGDRYLYFNKELYGGDVVFTVVGRNKRILEKGRGVDYYTLEPDKKEYVSRVFGVRGINNICCRGEHFEDYISKRVLIKI